MEDEKLPINHTFIEKKSSVFRTWIKSMFNLCVTVASGDLKSVISFSLWCAKGMEK